MTAIEKTQKIAFTRPDRDQTDRGAVLLLTALVMILILSIAAFATDLGGWYQQGQNQQRSVDVASLNGVQAYHREVDLQFDTLGVTAWTSLTTAQRTNVENQAMVTAVNTVVGLLEAAGYNFSSQATQIQLSPPPDALGAFSAYVIAADDGTVITITRSGSEISVEIVAEGAQFFSSMLRSAPEITRTSTSTQSNCGARCSVTFTLSPPQQGFEADGAGDGWAPLRYGDDEVWAVNHHSDLSKKGLSKGSIICMNRDGSTCKADGTQFSLVTPLDGLMFTAQQSVDYLDEDLGKLFFTALSTNSYLNPATGVVEANWSGLACFDVSARSWCTDAFKPLFRDNGRDGKQKVNATGPWAWTNSVGVKQLYVMLQNGELSCTTAVTMADCGSWTTAVSGLSVIPGSVDDAEIMSARIVGSKMYVGHLTTSGAAVIQCWNLTTSAACWANPAIDTVFSDSKATALFLAYDTSANPDSICLANPSTHRCYSLATGGSLGQRLPGYNNMVSGYGGIFSSAIEWQGRRVFFSNRNEDRTFCYDFENAESCGSIDQEILLPPSLSGRSTQPYAYGLLEGDCVAGLGHEALFFAFDALTLTKCQSTELTITILPCPCNDSGGGRFGELSVPADLLAVVDSLHASVTQADGVVLYTDEPIHLANGQLDLSVADQSQPYLTLKLVADAKEDAYGNFLWVADYDAELEVVVLPTLVS